MTVPSRSRKTAGLATECRDHGLELLGEDGARIEQHATARDARDDRGIERAQLRQIGVRCRVFDADEPGLELRTWERPTTNLGITLHELRVAAHFRAFENRLRTRSHTFRILRPHPPHRASP